MPIEMVSMLALFVILPVVYSSITWMVRVTERAAEDPKKNLSKRRTDLASEATNVRRAEAMAPLLQTEALCKSYWSDDEKIDALNSVSVEYRPGFHAITGPSGHGKSTLLNILAGLQTPDSGAVYCEGVRVDFNDERSLAAQRSRVAVVFQDGNLISHQTARENVALPLLLQRVDRHEALSRADALLEQVGLPDRGSHLPAQLSRGQQQRVALARAFATEASVILADEPTAALDPEGAEAVMKAFKELTVAESRVVIVVTHNHELARKYCDDVMVCVRGSLKPAPPRAVATKSKSKILSPSHRN